MTRTLLRGIGRLFTSEPGSEPVRGAALLIDGERIAWLGHEEELGTASGPASGDAEEVELGGALVTPGLIDAHSHPLYGGDRFAEIALRSAGASYAELAAAGGGITSTLLATRAASPTALASSLDARLERWLAAGTTTLEAKTGYHLDETGELEDVRILAARRDPGDGEPGSRRPALEVTFLGAHAVPPESAGDADGYAARVASWCRQAREAGARHADVFCDQGYFTVAQSRLVLEAARHAGLLPRIHADELALTGGSQLAAELGCSSADHLLRLDDPGIAALATGGVTATLAPVTALAMGKSPPARKLLDAGVTVALGSDHNPGTCGTTSMSLVIALAVAELSLSVAEALTAATAGGARSLRLEDRGRLAPGLRADLAVWPADHEGAFAWHYGLSPCGVWQAGRHRATEPPV